MMDVDEPEKTEEEPASEEVSDQLEKSE